MSRIRAIIVPEGHYYQEYLVCALNQANVDASTCQATWGCYLPALVDDLISQSPDIVHLQWPESMMSLDGQRASSEAAVHEISKALRSLRASGIKLVWTMHNLIPHEREAPEVEEAVYAAFASLCAGVIHHSHCGMNKALATYPYEGKHAVIHHGYFQDTAGHQRTKEEAREALSIPNEVRTYLAVGAVRPYKKLEVLIETIRRKGDERELLILAGRGSDEYAKTIEARVHEVPNIRWEIRDQGVPIDELSLYVEACDLLVFAHGHDNLTSGTPHLSQAYLRPQVTPNAPYVQEVLANGGMYFDSEEDEAASLRRTLDEISPEILEQKVKIIEAGRTEYTWDRVGEATARFYEDLLGRGR